MSRVLMAEFDHADALLEAAREGAREGDCVLDAFTPFPIEGLGDLLGTTSTRLRLVMGLGGLAVAALMFGTEYYSAVFDYPINSGGRPLNSWLTFVLPPFALGILGAAVSGFIALMVETGLPRLNYPLFEVEGFDQASQQRFLLAFASNADETKIAELHKRLERAGAIAIREVPS
jgi:hypothetical protein